MQKFLSLVTAVLMALVIAELPRANAATSVTFAPQTVLGPGVPPTPHTFDQNVVPVGSITLDMAADQTAYVISVMRANGATIRTLFENEVRCRWAGGEKTMLMGQNVYETTSSSPQWEDIWLTTRFLVHPGVATRVTCTANVRTASLAYEDSTIRLVSGSMRFADTSIDNTTTGQPAQSSVPAGLLNVDASNPVQREPSLDSFELAPGFRGLSVFGDTEYMICHLSAPCDKKGSSQAHFTLFINQWKADGSLCQTDSSATVTMDVPYYVHHVYVPLHKPDFQIRTDSGCVPKFSTYVRTRWIGGETGAVQGVAKNMTDSRGSTAKHDSDMSHIYAVPFK
ncbi:hypothetical protein BBK82_39075 [Lentzea guizhouensis]|uniref:Uncharacterized protein n=1 Tax=Lentzea guizhouensis TaxID=1586287 RepID=A0A1B2HTP2_9PSEU|nr:hypothetical protein [Lentzea guizhouensis]ANZ41100.1 hypothetical protein BBK82_39075 [Lentzea guizhouensis]